MKEQISRREFIRKTAVAAGAITAGLGGNFVAAASDQEAIKKTCSYNPNMEYRRLGSTGLWVSAVCLGGHFKGIAEVTGQKVNAYTRSEDAAANAALDKNRDAVLSRCIEAGINLVDACTAGEVETYGQLLQGKRREKMYLNCGMWPDCPRKEKWRSKEMLLKTLEDGLKEAKQEYFDIWRIVADDRGRHSETDELEFVAAIDQARQQGKIRFGGMSTHSNKWLKHLAETYPKSIQVMCFPYTAKTKELPEDSLFDAVRKYDIGTLGIKPFANSSLFQGAENAEEKNRRARMTLRYILGNPAITAPIPGLD
jgi:aryl-alcohol dehydrogenase-like predicted oxidoreductase